MNYMLRISAQGASAYGHNYTFNTLLLPSHNYMDTHIHTDKHTYTDAHTCVHVHLHTKYVLCVGVRV